MFVKTDTILDKILSHKVEEVARQKNRVPLNDLETMIKHAPAPLDFAAALRRDTVALIAEIKKASPSKGVLIENFEPVALAKTYAENGAAAISILTDQQFFMGDLAYLADVRRSISLVPLLRKEFVIDPYQVIEARAYGADAVLLIAAALEDGQMAELHTLIRELGMSALVEVHDEAEVERALKLKAPLIGINNRDLRTFVVDLAVTERLAKLIPPHITLAAESGIMNTEDVVRMGKMGAHAVLVGESLVKAPDIAAMVRAYSTQQRV